MDYKTKKVDFYLNLNKLQDNYKKFSNIGQVYYPVKSNSNEVIIRELDKLGSNFLIAYLNHFKKLISIGVEPSKCFVSSTLMSEMDTRYLYDNGVRFFTFDNIESLKTFLSYADKNKVKVALRINIGEVFDVFSHLGATSTELDEMVDILKDAGVTNYGISFYLQKELFMESDSLMTMIDFITKKFSQRGIRFIDIGGGLEPEKIDKEKVIKSLSSIEVSEIIVEPGRYLVGNAGFMETEVIRKKASNVFILQNGIYSGLLDSKLVGKKFDLSIVTHDEVIQLSKENDSKKREITFCGSSNDSIDIIGTYYLDEDKLNLIGEGTTVIVNDALSYVEELFIPLGGDFNIDYHIISGDAIELYKDVVRAHVCCSANREYLEKVNKCGCFYCLKVFNPKEIKTWCNGGETAVCPYCGIDSIIYDNKFYPVETWFLEKMKKHWFGDL